MPLPLRSSLAVLALFAAASAATGAQAAEFGDASVRSYSGQPLSADIELTDLTAQELADLQVRLARPDVFQGANVKMHPALAGASMTVVRRDGRRVLHVATEAPVQAEVLHLYFQLVSGGRERVRGVTLWLSPDPAPRPAQAAQAALAAAPAPAAERDDRPAGRRARSERPVTLVARASPGKEATAGERELLGAIGQALSAHGGKVEEREPARVATAAREKPERKDVRNEALKYASTADDFRRGAKPARPAVAKHEPKPEPKHEPKHEPAYEQASEPAAEKKAPQRSFLPSKADLAEAARATRASIEAGTPGAVGKVAIAPEAAPRSAPAALAAAPSASAASSANQPDPAMLNKLAELEGKLKTLQAQLGIASEGGAARVAAPAAGKPVAAPEASKPVDAAPATAKMPDATTVAGAAAAHPASAAQPEAAGHADTEHAAAPVAPIAPIAPVEEAKAPEAQKAEEKKAEEKKEAAPPPPEPKKEIKISRPKLLTFLFAGFLVLLGIFGVIVHFVRKKKLRRSPIVRQTWSRDEDEAPARIEPAIDPGTAPAPESKAA